MMLCHREWEGGGEERGFATQNFKVARCCAKVCGRGEGGGAGVCHTDFQGCHTEIQGCQMLCHVVVFFFFAAGKHVQASEGRAELFP